MSNRVTEGMPLQDLVVGRLMSAEAWHFAHSQHYS